MGCWGLLSVVKIKIKINHQITVMSGNFQYGLSYNIIVKL